MASTRRLKPPLCCRRLADPVTPAFLSSGRGPVAGQGHHSPWPSPSHCAPAFSPHPPVKPPPLHTSSCGPDTSTHSRQRRPALGTPGPPAAPRPPGSPPAHPLFAPCLRSPGNSQEAHRFFSLQQGAWAYPGAVPETISINLYLCLRVFHLQHTTRSLDFTLQPLLARPPTHPSVRPSNGHRVLPVLSAGEGVCSG